MARWKASCVLFVCLCCVTQEISSHHLSSFVYYISRRELWRKVEIPETRFACPGRYKLVRNILLRSEQRKTRSSSILRPVRHLLTSLKGNSDSENRNTNDESGHDSEESNFIDETQMSFEDDILPGENEGMKVFDIPKSEILQYLSSGGAADIENEEEEVEKMEAAFEMLKRGSSIDDSEIRDSTLDLYSDEAMEVLQVASSVAKQSWQFIGLEQLFVGFVARENPNFIAPQALHLVGKRSKATQILNDAGLSLEKAVEQIMANFTKPSVEYLIWYHDCVGRRKLPDSQVPIMFDNIARKCIEAATNVPSLINKTVTVEALVAQILDMAPDDGIISKCLDSFGVNKRYLIEKLVE